MPDSVPQELADLRRQIDAVDAELLRLLASRLELVLAVGELKRALRLAVYDPERERDLLARLASSAPSPLEPALVRRVFERIVDESRSAEQRRTGAR
ncbi:MAG: chorismate mutase [Polyangiaceae bacterium]|nr:chorismate mutase [Polyangiaceae bacterium]